ncbi:MAG: hypothetical protein AAFQ63_15745, partial [Cyanobacteria bacterium J06621_11]
MLISEPAPPSKTGIDALVNLDDLIAFVDVLERYNIAYALVGGVALMVTTDEARPTEDFDFICDAKQLDKLPDIEVISSDRNFARYQWHGITIDALLTSNKVFKTVVENYSAHYEIGGKQISSISADGLFLLKIYALPSLYRQGQLARADIYEADLVRLLRRNPQINEAALLNYLGTLLEKSQVSELTTIVS